MRLPGFSEVAGQQPRESESSGSRYRERERDRDVRVGRRSHLRTRTNFVSVTSKSGGKVGCIYY